MLSSLHNTTELFIHVLITHMLSSLHNTTELFITNHTRKHFYTTVTENENRILIWEHTHTPIYTPWLLGNWLKFEIRPGGPPKTAMRSGRPANVRTHEKVFKARASISFQIFLSSTVAS